MDISSTTTTLPLGVLEFLDVRLDRPVEELRNDGIEAAILADRLGYRRVWVPEHHARGVPSTNPLMLLPVLGSLTHRIRIGPAVSLLRIRDPYLLAEDLATAAHFCRDRLDVGLGRGDVRGPGTEVLDAARKNEAALDEAVRVVSELLERGNPWLDQPQGSYQQWMHGAGYRSAEVAAQRGLNYCHALFFNPDRTACLETLDRHREGHPAGIRAVALGVAANADRSRAQEDSKLAGLRVTCVGTAAECADEILELLALDVVDEVVITEQSRSPQDHRAALREIAQLVGAGLPAAAEAEPLAVPVG